MKTIEELISYKERKQHAVNSKKEKIKELNNYFGEHKYAILWAQVNPFENKEKNKLSPYIDGLLSAIPSELMGVKTSEAVLLGSKSGASALAMLLGKIAIRAIVKRVKTKSHKKKNKSIKENTTDETE